MGIFPARVHLAHSPRGRLSTQVRLASPPIGIFPARVHLKARRKERVRKVFPRGKSGGCTRAERQGCTHAESAPLEDVPAWEKFRGVYLRRKSSHGGLSLPPASQKWLLNEIFGSRKVD